MPGGQDEVKLVVKDLMDRGGVGFTYRLVVKPVETAFQLTLGDEDVPIPRGGTALVPVTVTRGGYNGPIMLDILGIPVGSGVTAVPGTVPAGQAMGVVGLKADAGSTFDARDVQVVGRGDDGQPVTASRTIVFAHQTISTPGFGMGGTIPSYARPFVSLTAAVTRPGPIVLNPGATNLAVPHGGTIEIPLEIARNGTARGTAEYQLGALSPPTGLTVAATEISEASTRVSVKVTAAADAPLGRLTIGLVAQAPRPGGATGARRGGGAAPRREAEPPAAPPTAAAVIIAIEVVRPSSPK